MREKQDKCRKTLLGEAGGKGSLTQVKSLALDKGRDDSYLEERKSTSYLSICFELGSYIASSDPSASRILYFICEGNNGSFSQKHILVCK